AIVFASPIYFHHLTASLKMLLDRFRSFIHVQITEHGLKHTPWQDWRKQFILLLCMGSPDAADALPVIDLFKFITKMLGHENTLHSIIGTRLAVPKQVCMTENELFALYKKLQLPSHLAEQDWRRNQDLIKQCYEQGTSLAMT
ncbi:MAG: NAD(P)H-dependent oxidoreductase, partial [Pseudomonadota bacterium]